MKWTLKINRLTGERSALDKETGERVTKKDSPEQYAKIRKNVKATLARKDKDDLMKSFGLVKCKGAVSGKTYWE
jgi:hypothetical protein